MNLKVNGKALDVPDLQADEPLVWVLRDTLGLVGTRFGCGQGICGSCTVLMNGTPVRSCQTKAGDAVGREITTLEGLAPAQPGGQQQLTAVQQAFLENPLQCCWCMSGHIMNATALLRKTPQPTQTEIEAAMGGNYCRCGGYNNIRRNVVRAAELIQQNGGKA
jgi:aerobic-type carbon monoxide dehydrogenase small subunit (CoxS/CutS family)